MGATKKLAEFYIKNIPKCATKFNIVRFGNVINSNGSVLPLFEHQIKVHKYITITHKDIQRYFMSIREAAQLVISSVIRKEEGEGEGEIYILNMGDLVKIHELALCIIRTKNLIPNVDIDVKFIGLKKGEKMIEELFTKKERENLIETEVGDVFRVKNPEVAPKDIEKTLETLEKLALKGGGKRRG
jgi:O-antigen biosynthesis protein WbqV